MIRAGQMLYQAQILTHHIRHPLPHARQLLTTTRLSIAEVAECAGFSSGEYLCVAFKNQAWPSPKTFRAQAILS